jgi:hypothetical protein
MPTNQVMTGKNGTGGVTTGTEPAKPAFPNGRNSEERLQWYVLFVR